MNTLTSLAKPSRLGFILFGSLLAVGAMADSYSLTVTGANENTTGTIHPLNESVEISSLYGSLKDTTTNTSQTLGEFFCVDTADQISTPTTYNVNLVRPATGTLAVAASLITDFSAGYPGPVFNGSTADLNALNSELGFNVSNSQLDAGLQLALWETVNGVTSSSSTTLNKIASDMISINNGATVSTGVELQSIGGKGQSMLYVPGIGGPTPTPEPFSMAIGLSGIGMFIARRRAAKK